MRLRWEFTCRPRYRTTAAALREALKVVAALCRATYPTDPASPGDAAAINRAAFLLRRNRLLAREGLAGLAPELERFRAAWRRLVEERGRLLAVRRQLEDLAAAAAVASGADPTAAVAVEELQDVIRYPEQRDDRAVLH